MSKNESKFARPVFLRRVFIPTLWQHKCESPITVLKILYNLAGSSLNFEALGFSL